MVKNCTKIAIAMSSLLCFYHTASSQTSRVVEESRETIEITATDDVFKCHEGVAGGYGATRISISGWKFPRRFAANHDAFAKTLVYPSTGSGTECSEILEAINTQISASTGKIEAKIHRTVSKMKLPSSEDQNYFCVLSIVDKTKVVILGHELVATKIFRMKEVPLEECGL